MSISFEKFFENFWENQLVNPTSVGGENSHLKYLGSEEEREAIRVFEQERQARKKNPKLYVGSFYTSPARFNAPFTSIAKELLQCLKEDLISELIVISSFRKATAQEQPEVKEFLEKEIAGKKDKMSETFGKFPQTRILATEVVRVGKEYQPFRWEIIKNECPDFDIFIDDSKGGVIKTIKAFSEKPEKCFVFPDYRSNREVVGNNVYHVKTTISDLKDEDFTKAAEEYKARKAQELASRQTNFTQERERIFENNLIFI